jgi:hypothetical protein
MILVMKIGRIRFTNPQDQMVWAGVLLDRLLKKKN